MKTKKEGEALIFDKEHLRYWRYSKESIKAEYMMVRDNGDVCDNPSRLFPFDGDYVWVDLGKGRKSVKYVSGYEDEKWMMEKDRSYVLRLEREGRLDREEPRLKTEVPSLYQEILSTRKSAIQEEQKGEEEKCCQVKNRM